ncbi:Ig-like domain repeat protein [Actinoplanes sp. HUAS TT8]|uniref:Ig-like domain-containing protein n=1 Tax=Actinoplanes sp. HUAS TT8 TaxID=3447453 RepID=UPI003F522F71
MTGTTALAVGVAAPAQADSVKALAIASVGDVLVDGVHQHVFVSDPASGKVVVTDYDGNQLAGLPVDDASDMALSTDSSQVYVTSRSDEAIFALDTTSLAQSAKYSLGAIAPKSVAVAGGRVWFSYSDDSSHGYLGNIDPTADSPEPVLGLFATIPPGPATLASASAAPNRLAVAGYSQTAVLDVAGDTVTVVDSVEDNGNIAGMALSPQGDRLAMIHIGGMVATLRDANNLAAKRNLAVDNFPAAVDIATDGTIAVRSSDAWTPGVYIYSPTGQLFQALNVEPGVGQPHGLAWEPDGKRLFDVIETGSTFRLEVISNPRVATSTLTLSGKSPVVPGEPVTFTGKLTSPASLPAGTTVSIARSGTALDDAVIAADGSFTFTDTPPTLGTATYQVSYAGDGTHLSSTAGASVVVARTASALSVAGPLSAIPGTAFTITGQLTSSVSLPSGTSVTVSRSGAVVGVVPVAADGTFSFADTVSAAGTFVYDVSYAGDEVHLPSTTVSTSVAVSLGAATLALAGPSSATRAKALTITGKLASSVPLPAGRTVAISKTDLDYPAGRSLGTKAVAADGSFSFADTPAAGGTVTYKVTYAGDDAHSPVTATKSVAVSRTTPTLAMSNNGKVYNYGQTVSFTAHLGATYKNRTVEIWADPAGTDAAKRLVKRAVVNSAGNVVASFKLTRDTAMTAVFTGDAQTAPRTMTAKVGARVSLSLTMSKYYKTAKIGGTSYRYYHVKGQAQFSTTMTSGAKRKVYVAVEYYSKGKWKSLDRNYFGATDRLYISGSGLNGIRLRVRAAYVRGSSGDSLNTTTWTPYQYFTYTK